MIYHNVGLTKAEAARLRRVGAVLLGNDKLEISDLETAEENDDIGPDNRDRLHLLRRRRKFLTKSNLLRIFVLRGLEDAEQSGPVEAEQTADLMVRLGRAKGRPNGRG